MFRLWFLRGIWRNTGKIAKNTARGADKAIPGKGFVNMAAGCVWVVTFFFLIAVGIPVLFAAIVAIAPAVYANHILPKGLKEWQNAGARYQAELKRRRK